MEIQYLTYPEQLKSEQWQKKRTEIFQRDKFTCKSCSREMDKLKFTFLEWTVIKVTQSLETPFGLKVDTKWAPLHVHHTYYEVGRKAWEYENNSLQTLCATCHQDFHDNNIVPVYKIHNGKKVEIRVEQCLKCNGSGYLPQYSHYMDGICFECQGHRFTELK